MGSIYPIATSPSNLLFRELMRALGNHKSEFKKARANAKFGVIWGLCTWRYVQLSSLQDVECFQRTHWPSSVLGLGPCFFFIWV